MRGEVLGSSARKIDECMDALQAETIGAFHALTFATNASMTRIEMETDAINLKMALP
jgi:hypothetical protein